MKNKTLTTSHDGPAPLDFAAANVSLSEFAQAKVRCYLNILLMSLALVAFYYQPTLGIDRVILTFCATAGSAAFLFLWAWAIKSGYLTGRWRTAQRVTSIVLDNVSITWILWFGGQSLAGIYGIYIWISVGYGLRYGLPWLYANLVTSVVGFSIGGYFSPFWSQFPGLFGGLIFGLIIVPVYTGFLIKRLNQTTAERESAFRAKSQFIARMSHELRTPLHGIISTADLMNREPLSPSMREKMRMISVSSTTLLDLINKVLDISKFESGKVDLVTQPMDLHAVISDAATIVSPKATEKGLQVYTYIDPEVENVLIGSPQQLGEVLVNLSGNAAKFTEAGYISLRALFVEETLETVSVRFEILDTGPGIPEGEVEHIFESFAQVDDSITRKHGGTGLGTAIAREIVHLMGGEISVASTVGIGTQFSFEITLDKHKGRDNIRDIYPIDALLFGLDKPDDEILQVGLRKLGATVSRYVNIRTFEDELEANNSTPLPEIIFIDVQNYYQNLGAITYQIAQLLGSNRTIPIVAIGQESFRAACVDAGFSMFIERINDQKLLERTLSLARAYKQDYVDGEALRSEITGLRILLADDNSTNQRIAQLTLEEAGHFCVVTSNGREFLEKLEVEEFDIGILDMHMPIMDGIEVAKIVQFSYFDRDMPLMMMTADNRIEARAAAEGAGIAKFLTKPLKPAGLLKAIAEMTVSNKSIDTERAGGQVLNMLEKNVSDETIASEAVEELMEFMEIEEAREFFAEFFEDSEKQIHVLEGDVEENGIELVKREMHSLAGAAATIGANKLSRLAREIELMPAQEILLQSEERRIALNNSFRECKEYLVREYLNNKPSQTA